MKSLDNEVSDEEEKEETKSNKTSKSRSQAKEHKSQLERLKDKVYTYIHIYKFFFLALNALVLFKV